MANYIYQHMMISKEDRDLYKVKWGKKGMFYFIRVEKHIVKYGEDPLQFELSSDRLSKEMISEMFKWEISPRQVFFLEYKT